MSDVFLLVAILAGFVAAPLANRATDDGPPPRFAAGALLISTLFVLGWIALTLNRGLIPPGAWIWCAACVLLGVGICAYVFTRQRLPFAIVAGAAMVAAILMLLFWTPALIRASQNGCAAVLTGMTADQVSASILSQ